MTTWQVELPTTIKVGRKNYSLNLNVYRNTHYHLLNTIKQNFTEEIIPRLYGCPSFKKINITYNVHHKGKRRYDIGNICSVVDKFFCDTLVKAGIISDDNSEIVAKIIFQKVEDSTKEYSYVTAYISGETNEDSVDSGRP